MKVHPTYHVNNNNNNNNNNNKLFIILSGEKHLLSANNKHSEAIGPAGSSCPYNPQVRYNLSQLYQHSRLI